MELVDLKTLFEDVSLSVSTLHKRLFTKQSMQICEYASDSQRALRLSSRTLECLPAEFASERAYAALIKAALLQRIVDQNDAL